MILLFQPVHHSAILHCLDWATMSSRRKFRQLQLGHSIYYGDYYYYFHDGSKPIRRDYYELQVRVMFRLTSHNLVWCREHSPSSMTSEHPEVFALPTTRATRHRDSPLNLASFYFNNLPPSIKSIKKPSCFKKEIKPLILSSICACSQHP